MKNLNYSFNEEQTVDFIIDTDKEFNWVKSINDLKYQRLFIYIDKNVEKFVNKSKTLSIIITS
mgnify:FL=1